jgi:hypothetical protein
LLASRTRLKKFATLKFILKKYILVVKDYFQCGKFTKLALNFETKVLKITTFES